MNFINYAKFYVFYWKSDRHQRTLHFEFEAQLILRENRYFLVQLRGAFWVIRGPEMVDFEGISWSYDALRWRRNGRFWREERAEAEIMNRQDGPEMVDFEERNGPWVPIGDFWPPKAARRSGPFGVEKWRQQKGAILYIACHLGSGKNFFWHIVWLYLELLWIEAR